jgi:hypothetical protein
MDESEIYNVENYTDRELFQILDINNPTDRELEISILKNIRQYEKDREENPKSSKLWNFFNNMYKKFFDVDEDSSDEESGMEGFAYESPNFTFSPVVDATKDASIKNRITGNVNLATNSSQNINSLGANLSGAQQQLQNTSSQQMTIQNNAGNEVRGNVDLKQLTTHNIEYVKDNLNPIKRETMFKMISIDSQFRDDARTTGATNFTMNLSSSIENVISIKLYSIQIPYTWYMVNDGFGSNFFYIKGHSPGINNGNHDIQIMIDSGNYTQAELMSAINNSLYNLSNNPEYIMDVSFGKTQAFYNSTNAKVRIAVDLKKTFSETDYQLYFPNWSSPNVRGSAKNDSLASFLGYNFENYYINTVYGNWNSFLGNTFAAESTVANYKLIEGVNDYFSVIQYVGPDAYVPGVSTNLKQVDVKFSLAPTNGTTYSRNQLYSNLKTQIAANAYFDHEYSDISLVSVPITIPQLYEWEGYNHYELSVKLNRKKTMNSLDAKIVVKFPEEIEDAGNGFYGNNFIWTGAESCFRFDNSYNEISEIVSETETLFTNYVVGANDYLQFNCIKPLFNVPENNYSAKVDPSTANGYLLDVYTQKINDAIITMNDATVTSTKPNGTFSINTAENIRNTGFDVINALPTFKIDISKTFDQSTYIIDLTESFFTRSPFFFPNTVANLTEINYTLSKRYGFVGNYKISAFDKIVLYPKTTGGLYGNGFGNQNQAPIEILLNPPYGNEFNGSFEQISAHLKDVFEAVVDPETGENILMNVELLSKPSGNNVDVSFNLRISKNLNESDYQMAFVTDSNSSTNPWAKLYFGASYNLSDYENMGTGNAIVQGNEEVYQNTIEIRENYNQIQFIPYYDGLYDKDGLNDITITIPTSSSIGSNYTRDQLFAEINKQLSANSLTQNMGITLFNIGQKQYSKFRMNINKTFTSKDYKLVFYDPISFSYCDVGTTGGRSVRTITWESTLGWLMGFHTFTEYILEDFTTINLQNFNIENYRYNLYTTDSGAQDPYLYSYQSTTGKISVVGDSILNTNLYNYFLIILDDYIQNHVNDGLVTITSLEKDVALPTYASRVTYQCDPVSGKKVAVSASNRENMNLSSKQLYAMNQVLEARRTKEKSYSVGPVMRDVFALVPLKLSGLAFGSTYMEFGGTLQNQDRKYFGPVRIQKLSVKLMNDKGDVVNLNGGNWSFTIICEIMVANK